MACLHAVQATKQARQRLLPSDYLRFAVQATKQARRNFLPSSTLLYDLLDCKTPNRSDGLFYPLTVNDSTICNQLGLGNDYKQGMYTRRLIYMPCWFYLQTL